MAVFGHLNPLAVALVVAAVLIFVLLGLRIGSMVRRERKPVIATARARRASPGGSLDPSIGDNTDWGFDQNKRAAISRMTGVSNDLTYEGPSTQWSKSEVQKAAEISMQAYEGMGKSNSRPPSPYRTSQNPYFQGETHAGAPMEVEEVADVLLQAELLVQLGDPKQAMTLLSQHIHDTEQPGPAVWLMLLNLYQTTGRKSQYDALAIGFRTLFNAAVPPWSTSSQTAARDLENYPQVMMKVQTGWPKPEVRAMLEGLLNDDRGGSRQGFSLTAYREILFLIEILDVLDQMSIEDGERDEIRRKLAAPH